MALETVDHVELKQADIIKTNDDKTYLCLQGGVNHAWYVSVNESWVFVSNQTTLEELDALGEMVEGEQE